MKKQLKNKSLLLLLLLFILCSCTKETHWNNSFVFTQNSQNSSLTYSNPKNILEVEFLHFEDQVLCFLNVLTLETNNRDMPILLSTDRETLQSLGYLREGNQKIRLNEEAKNFLAQALCKNQKVRVKIEEIEEDIFPENFSVKYKKMLDNNSIYNKLIRSIY